MLGDEERGTERTHVFMCVSTAATKAYRREASNARVPRSRKARSAAYTTQVGPFRAEMLARERGDLRGEAPRRVIDELEPCHAHVVTVAKRVRRERREVVAFDARAVE